MTNENNKCDYCGDMGAMKFSSGSRCNKRHCFEMHEYKMMMLDWERAEQARIDIDDGPSSGMFIRGFGWNALIDRQRQKGANI